MRISITGKNIAVSDYLNDLVNKKVGKLERYFRQGISYAHGSYKEFFTRPLSCALLLVSVFCVVWPLLSEHLKKKKAEAAVPAAGGSEAKDD